MFSLDNFYHTVYTNFFIDTIVKDVSFQPFGSIDVETILFAGYFNLYHYNSLYQSTYIPMIYFYDQEPLHEKVVNDLRIKEGISANVSNWSDTVKRLRIFANSEKSKLKKELCDYWIMADWYYFFHGFAALDWYRDLKYYPKFDNNFNKVFICLNRLCTKDRSYRLNLVSKFSQKKLLDKGIVSLCLEDLGTGTWQQEIEDPYSKLSLESKKLIYDEINKIGKSLIADKHLPPSYSSAVLDHSTVKLHTSALWNVVTETVFYYDKLHLTEKIFKPIVTKRPFILVAAPGNLNYLKSYGFKTFDRWIDESYDCEQDNDKRLDMITAQLQQLCKLNLHELKIMHTEMQEILDYNYNHFFGNFKNIIVDEMVDNLEVIFAKWNFNRIDGREYDISKINFAEIKQRLKS